MKQSLHREWLGPPLATFCGEIPVQRVVAQSPSGAVVLERIRAFRQGCALDYVLAADRLDEDVIAEGRSRGDLRQLFQPDDGHASPVFRVTLADGASSNTEETRNLWTEPADESGPPAAPVLVSLSGAGAVARERVLEMNYPLWLWPLPPRGAITVSVDWRKYGISGAVHELDAEEMISASERARPYRPQ